MNKGHAWLSADDTDNVFVSIDEQEIYISWTRFAQNSKELSDPEKRRVWARKLRVLANELEDI